MAGTVVTFYSYKGGVGRSFSLANVGLILAQWGYRVLIIDWDIEAPGLHQYFSGYTQGACDGVIDFLVDCAQDKPKEWDKYIQAVIAPDVADNLALMPATRETNGRYTEAVQALDWDVLYDEHALGEHIEVLRAAWIENFDFVLIDSRTGVTDFSGLTTAQLPDILGFLFTANHQSLDGCCDIARRAMEARRRLPIDRPALLPLPIIAKFEQREEFDRAQSWRTIFAAQLTEFFAFWAPQSIQTSRLVDLLTIPYVPRWSFGEELAAILEPYSPGSPRTASAPVSYPLETIASLLSNKFDKIELLMSSRDEYVLTARESARAAATAREMRKEATAATPERLKVFLSYSAQDRELVDQLIKLLEAQGFITLGGHATSFAGEKWTARLQEYLDEADAFIVLVSENSLSSPYVQREVENFLRRTLRSTERKPLVPLVLSGVDPASMVKSRLADYQGVVIDPSRDLQSQLEPVFGLLRSDAAASSLTKPVAVTSVPLVFLNYHEVDVEIATRLRDKIGDLFAWILPSFDTAPEEIIAILEQNFLYCDSLILLRGTANTSWVRYHLLQYRKLSIKRDHPLGAFVLLDVPPEHKPELDLAFPGLTRIDARSGISDEVVDRLVGMVRPA